MTQHDTPLVSGPCLFAVGGMEGVYPQWQEGALKADIATASNLMPMVSQPTCVSAAAVQVWPYLKPLRKWIKKQQRGKQPDGVWDMPQILTTPTPQQQQRGKQPDDLWDMPQILTTPTPQQQQREQARGGNGSLLQPVMSQQVQQLAHSERRSGTGSPKYMQHHQFHEAAIAQARQQAAVSTGTLPAPSIPVGTTPSAGRSGGSATGASSSTQDISCSPLVKLFGSATVARVGSSNDMLSSSPGQAFKFNRQPILHALTSPAGAAGVPLRHQISGRG